MEKVVRDDAPEAFLSSAPGNASIYWRLLRPELLTMLKEDEDYTYGDDGLAEKGG